MVSFVNISEVRVEDGGTYRCRADNGHAWVEHAKAVHVRGRPVTRRIHNLTVIQGENMSRACPIAGHPLIHFTWLMGKINHNNVMLLT